MAKIEKNNNYLYDLNIGEKKENEFAYLFDKCSTFEIKYDLKENNRHFVEYKRENIKGIEERSGISVSRADYYVFCKKGYYLVVRTSHVRKLLKKIRNTLNIEGIRGGDGKRSFGYIVTETEILDFCRFLDISSKCDDSLITPEIAYKGKTYVLKEGQIHNKSALKSTN